MTDKKTDSALYWFITMLVFIAAMSLIGTNHREAMECLKSGGEVQRSYYKCKR